MLLPSPRSHIHLISVSMATAFCVRGRLRPGASSFANELADAYRLPLNVAEIQLKRKHVSKQCKLWQTRRDPLLHLLQDGDFLVIPDIDVDVLESSLKSFLQKGLALAQWPDNRRTKAMTSIMTESESDFARQLHSACSWMDGWTHDEVWAFDFWTCNFRPLKGFPDAFQLNI